MTNNLLLDPFTQLSESANSYLNIDEKVTLEGSIYSFQSFLWKWKLETFMETQGTKEKNLWGFHVENLQVSVLCGFSWIDTLSAFSDSVLDNYKKYL